MFRLRSITYTLLSTTTTTTRSESPPPHQHTAAAMMNKHQQKITQLNKATSKFMEKAQTNITKATTNLNRYMTGETEEDRMEQRRVAAGKVCLREGVFFFFLRRKPKKRK